MTSDSHTADAGENTGQERRPGPLVVRGEGTARPQPAGSVLLPPLVARSGAGASRGARAASIARAEGNAPEPAARDFLEVRRAGGGAVAEVGDVDRTGDILDSGDAGGEPVEPLAGEGSDAVGSEALPEPAGTEEVDLPWLTTPEDEDALDSAPGAHGEAPAPPTGSAEALAEREPESAIPFLAEGALEAGTTAAMAGAPGGPEGGADAHRTEGAFDLRPEDPALLVADRLERIAHSLRTRGASGPMIEQQDDPLAVLVTGYLLGLTESKSR